MSEAREGLESVNADADPPAIWGRLHERGRNRYEHGAALRGYCVRQLLGPVHCEDMQRLSLIHSLAREDWYEKGPAEAGPSLGRKRPHRGAESS